MNLREVLRFELSYQLQRITPWLLFVVLLVFAAGTIRFASVPEALETGVPVTAPFVILGVTIFGCAIWMLSSGAIAGEAASRDVQTRMHSLLYTSPLGKTSYLGGRFLAALFLNALILLGIPLGTLLGTWLPGVDPALKGAFQPSAYLAPYLFFALPNALAITAVQFGWASLRKRGIAAFLGSVILLFVSHFLVGGLAEGFGQKEIAARFDIVGFIGTWSYLERTWTPIERSTRLLLPEGDFLINRLAWTGIAAIVLAFTWSRFRFEHVAASRWSGFPWTRKRASKPLDPAAEHAGAVNIPNVQRRFGLATYWSQTVAIAVESFRSIFKLRSVMLFLLIFVMPVFLFAINSVNPLGIPLLPVTGRLISVLAPALDSARTPLILIPFLLIYYAGELVWRERDAGISDITDTSPVSEWALFTGKFLGLALVILVWLTLLLADGLLVQVDRGYAHHEIGLFIKTLFGIQLTNYLLFTLIVIVAHVLAGRKYLGYLLAMAVFIAIGGASTLGIKHHLLVYASDPGWEYTDMWGFGKTMTPWLWFKAYWIGWALLLAVLARLFWPRAKDKAWLLRMKLAGSRFSRATAIVAFIGMGLIFGAGGFIFYNTNILNTYAGQNEGQEQAIRYEQLYGRYKTIPQPVLKGVVLNAELYPEHSAAKLHGTYLLKNEGAVPIDSIHLTTVPGVETGPVNLDRPVAKAGIDTLLGYRIYALKKALQPGDSLRLSFTVKLSSSGFSNTGFSDRVAVNGSYLRNQDCMPAIGYQPDRELAAPGLRKKYGLGPRRRLASLFSANPRKLSTGFERISFEATVGTSGDQSAVMPGKLVRSWRKEGRHYTQFRCSSPIQNQYAFFSGRYAVATSTWTNAAGRVVTIRVFHHPGHTSNVSRMLKSARASLSFYSEKFGPYPYDHLTIVERGDSGNSLHAEASMIAYSETYALFNPNDGPGGFDLPYYALAHEVAHQWWGAAQLQPAKTEGIVLLSEGLAVYSGMQVLEKSHGADHFNKYLQFLRDSYEQPRTRAGLPLLRATDSFLGYRKGPLALYTLSRYIGWDRTNLALRRMLEHREPGRQTLSTTLDLYRELKTVTPDSLHYLLHDLFETNTWWEFKLTKAAAKQIEGGKWQLTLGLRARKVTVDAAGNERESPMNDWVEFGAFDEDGREIYLANQRVRTGEQTLTLTFATKPERAEIDPRGLLVEMERRDNGREVER